MLCLATRAMVEAIEVVDGNVERSDPIPLPMTAPLSLQSKPPLLSHPPPQVPFHSHHSNKHPHFALHSLPATHASGSHPAIPSLKLQLCMLNKSRKNSSSLITLSYRIMFSRSLTKGKRSIHGRCTRESWRGVGRREVGVEGDGQGETWGRTVAQVRPRRRPLLYRAA